MACSVEQVGAGAHVGPGRQVAEWPRRPISVVAQKEHVLTRGASASSYVGSSRHVAAMILCKSQSEAIRSTLHDAQATRDGPCQLAGEDSTPGDVTRDRRDVWRCGYVGSVCRAELNWGHTRPSKLTAVVRHCVRETPEPQIAAFLPCCIYLAVSQPRHDSMRTSRSVRVAPHGRNASGCARRSRLGGSPTQLKKHPLGLS
jgi:hypothetical protein